jgi:sugar O-acyltransferase (sialic acid O-acetyltransferase NeuD family)
MNKDLVIYGSGGFGREVLELIKDINLQKEQKWNIIGFINDIPETYGTYINEYQILGGIDWLEEYEEPISIVIATGNSKTRKLISGRLQMHNIEFPNIVHPSVNISSHVELGKGNIICAGNILTTNINIEDFVIINLACTVGHDVIVKNYSTILPGSNISGNVLIEECVEIGTKSCVIPQVKIGRNSIIGAGSTVIKDLPANCTAVGSPARPIKFHSVT